MKTFAYFPTLHIARRHRNRVSRILPFLLALPLPDQNIFSRFRMHSSILHSIILSQSFILRFSYTDSRSLFSLHSCFFPFFLPRSSHVSFSTYTIRSSSRIHTPITFLPPRAISSLIDFSSSRSIKGCIRRTMLSRSTVIDKYIYVCMYILRINNPLRVFPILCTSIASRKLKISIFRRHLFLSYTRAHPFFSFNPSRSRPFSLILSHSLSLPLSLPLFLSTR